MAIILLLISTSVLNVKFSLYILAMVGQLLGWYIILYRPENDTKECPKRCVETSAKKISR